MAVCAICLVLTGLAGTNAYAQVNSAKPVTAEIRRSDNSVPDPTTTDFQAFIVGRESEVLTKASAGCQVGDAGGITFFQIQLGSFPTQWSAGETLSITVTDTTLPEEALTQTVTIDANGSNEQNLGTLTLQQGPDETPPVITIDGDNPATVCQGATYTDGGVTVTDNRDNPPPTAVVTNNVDTSTVGNYTVDYSATDQAGNTATASRDVTVEDCTAPVIAINGDNPVTVCVDTTYTDAGATATDNVDPDVTVNTTNNVVIGTPGNYTVDYSATDSAGNNATATRNVTVENDTAPPNITVNGDNPASVTVGEAYSDAGATAVDTCQGTVTVQTDIPTYIDQVGETFTVTYTATDGTNPATATRTVNVVADGQPPVITIIGDNPASVLINTTYTDAGATATDNIDGTVTVTTVSNNVDTSTAFNGYEVVYSATDSSDNTATATRVVNVVTDNVPPVINLNGTNPHYVELNGTYTEPGAVATDNVDPNFAATPSGTVNTGIPGTYVITYTATDAAGNNATPVTRDVIVRDPNTAPTLTLTDPVYMTICKDGTYTEPGYSATDMEDGDLTAIVTTSNPVDVSVPATYYIKYNVTDSGGIMAPEQVRTVIVDDCTSDDPPVITISGANPASVVVNTTYTDPGATATDDKDGTVPVSSSGTVNTAVVGAYTITYTATDSAGQTATATRTVNVVDGSDTVNPVITVIGANPATVQMGAAYMDLGATAIDNVDGDITARITVSGLPVNTAVAGTYTVTYTVSDTAGNSATAMRTVRVSDGSGCENDTVPPVISINGANPMMVMVNTTYTDAGATATDNVDGPVTVTTTSNTVNTAQAGDYPVIYSATDNCGNTATATRIVTVSSGDSPHPPVITPPDSGDPDTIDTQGYSHPSGTGHASTQWQVGTDPNFSNIVLTTNSTSALTSLPIPSLVLDDNTTYYVRANYMDAAEGQSGWSTGESFTTGETNNDADDDGVPDDQEVVNPSATFPDVDVTRAMFVKSAVGDAIIGVEIAKNVTTITSLEAVHPEAVESMPDSLDGVHLELGLIGFKIQVVTGAEAEVIVHLSKDMTTAAKWYLYDVLNGWYEAPEAQYTIEDPRTIRLQLEDGGFGDVDGVKNGWIVDPSGYGYSASTGSVTGDDCFIESSASASATPAVFAMALALIAAVFAMMVFVNRKK